MAVQKEKLLTVNLILILIYSLNDFFLQRDGKFFTVYSKCPQIPLSPSLHFATRVQRSRVVRLS
jgi:hypothetical protein